MNEKPILFSGEMVKAILDGRKTQTRRVVKSQPPEGYRQWGRCINGNIAFTDHPLQGEKGNVIHVKGPYGDEGDRLWVRETCAIGINDDCDLVCDYMADGKRKWFDLTPENEKYSATYINDGKRPSIFMPRWASRITLEITGVRVERLQDITDDDAKAEGVGGVGTFGVLWNEINAKRGHSWDTNPWVWVIEFKKVSEA